VLDNGTGTVEGGTSAAVAQRDSFNAVGGSLRAQWDSLMLNSGVQLEHHRRPYPGTGATADAAGNVTPGERDVTSGTSILQYNELDCIVFPWFVPAVRTELTRLNVEGAASGSLLRIMPGVATLIRPNIKLVITGDFERASGLPPVGSWSAAGGLVVPAAGGSKFQAEQLIATAAVAF
jgi:hypothetical protein